MSEEQSPESEAARAAFSRLEGADAADPQSLRPELEARNQQLAEEKAKERRMTEMGDWSDKVGGIAEAKAQTQRENTRDLKAAVEGGRFDSLPGSDDGTKRFDQVVEASNQHVSRGVPMGNEEDNLIDQDESGNVVQKDATGRVGKTLLRSPKNIKE